MAYTPARKRARTTYKKRRAERDAEWYRLHRAMMPTPSEYTQEPETDPCEICGQTERGKRIAKDHDHVTGFKRGFLCQLCNMGLGSFRDDPTLMLRAIGYLQKYRDLQGTTLAGTTL